MNEMETKGVIERLTCLKTILGYILLNKDFEGMGEEDKKQCDNDMGEAIKALKEKLERENPNTIKTKIVSPVSYGGCQGLSGKRYVKSKRK